MKTFRLFLWVIAASLAFAACSDDDDDLSEGKRFKVTVTADANGTAVADPAEAEAGVKVTLKATASEGFSFETWTVESGTVTLADATAAETSFTMPKGDVVIRASFTEGGAKEYADILPLIKDPIFKEYVLYRMEYPERINEKNHGAWDKDLDGKLSSKEAAEVLAINFVGDFDVFDHATLEDLQYFPNLEVFITHYYDFTGGGLEVFKKLPKLNYLDGSSTITGENDVVDLTGCPELSTVYWYDSYLYNLDASNCPNLVELDIHEASVAKLDLSASTMLTHLDLTLTEISSLDVSHCSYLQKLNLSSCTDLADLKLPQNSRLVSLQIYNTQIRELDATQHPNLIRLGCSKCPNLTKLDVSKCIKLQELTCSYSPIGKLDLSHCPDMDLLWATCCKLTEINLTGCSKLFEVYCEHNNLTEIDASDLGFWYDDQKGVMTNTYSLYCGQQVLPGTEPGLTQDFEIKHELWKAVAQPVKVYLRQEQLEFWDALKETPKNFKAEALEVN